MREPILLPAKPGTRQYPTKQADQYQNDTGQDLTVPDSGQTLATAIIAASGVGKTILAGILAEQGVLRGIPQVIIDPVGSLSSNLLHLLLVFLSHFPPEEHDCLWQRVRYIPVGDKDYVTPFPIYYHRDREADSHREGLLEVAERLLTVITLSHPHLVSQASVSYPAMRRIGVNAGIMLSALGYQPTEAEDLLLNTLAWEQSGRFDTALRRHPSEAKAAVSYFRNQYLPLSRGEKAKQSSTFLDHVFRLSADPSLRALFGAAASYGIDWEEVLEKRRQTVILDFSHVRDPETRRFATLWILLSLLEHLKGRGRRKKPVGLIIDEFAALTHKAHEGANPLAELLDEFLAQWSRRNRVFFTCCFQSLDQLPEELQQTILRLGNLVCGRAGTMREARVLADVLFRTDPYKVKHYRKVWGKTDPVRLFDAGGYPRWEPGSYFVLDYEPEHMPLSEQLEVAAQRIVALPRFSFFIRPATEEGSVSESVSKLTIRKVIADPETEELVFPDETLTDRLKALLAKRSGIPVATILKEQESRLAGQEVRLTPMQSELLPGTPKKPGTAKALPPGEVAATPRTVTQRPPRKAAPPPPGNSTPQLDAEQRAFLDFISANPDTPTSEVYKRLGISWRKGNQLRESLTIEGLIAELEVRRDAPAAGSPRSDRGRPSKLFIPTLSAFECLGTEPPHGRGSAVHRYLQERVVARATAKGYRTQVEKAIGNGAICDVHVEREGVRIACEIAVVSLPQRELAHIQHCLAAGYDQIYDIFIDEHLLMRTQEALLTAFTEQEVRKVRLLPVSKLAHLG